MTATGNGLDGVIEGLIAKKSDALVAYHLLAARVSTTAWSFDLALGGIVSNRTLNK